MTAGPSSTLRSLKKKLAYKYMVRGARYAQGKAGAPNVTGMSATLNGDGTRTLNLTGHSFGHTVSSVFVGSSPVPERNIRCNVITWTDDTVVCAVSPLAAGE